MEALEVRADFATKIPFALVTAFDNVIDDLVELLFRQLIGTERRIKAERINDLGRASRTDPVNVTQRIFDAFVIGNVYTKDAWHFLLLLLCLF